MTPILGLIAILATLALVLYMELASAKPKPVARKAAKPLRIARALAHKHKRHIERARTLSEILGCGFVAVETHIGLFIVVLIVWAFVDVAALLDI